jgi:hypothetical protein
VKIRSKIIITTAAALAVATSGAAIAYASIPDSSGVIHGCYTVKTGALRVIDTAKGQTCATGQHALKWNQKGPQGPAGPAGVSGYKIESYTPSANGGQGDNPLGSYSVDSINATHVKLYCPAGKVALSDGYSTNINAPADIRDAYPFSDSGGSGYKLTFQENSDLPPSVAPATVYVTCANAS